MGISMPPAKAIEDIVCKVAEQKWIEDKATGAICSAITKELPIPNCQGMLEKMWDKIVTMCPRGLAVEAGTLAVSFSDCGDASTDAVVKDVVPKTITAGSTTTITGSGSLKKDITGGSYEMRMTGVLSSVLVKNCNGDASKANTCDIVAPLLGKVGTIAYQPVAFPIKAGDISGVPKVAVTLKAGLPASLETTTTTLKVTASNGDKLICVQIMTKAAAQSVSGSDTNLLVAVQSHPASSSLPGLASAVPQVEAGTLAVSFNDCGDASTDAVVKDVVPKTITAGVTTTITGSGSLKKDIAGGSFD